MQTTSRPWLDTRELSEQIGFKEQTLKEWRMKGTGPKFVNVGGRIRYLKSSVDEWIDSLPLRQMTFRG